MNEVLVIWTFRWDIKFLNGVTQFNFLDLFHYAINVILLLVFINYTSYKYTICSWFEPIIYAFLVAYPLCSCIGLVIKWHFWCTIISHQHSFTLCCACFSSFYALSLCVHEGFGCVWIPMCRWTIFWFRCDAPIYGVLCHFFYVHMCIQL